MIHVRDSSLTLKLRSIKSPCQFRDLAETAVLAQYLEGYGEVPGLGTSIFVSVLVPFLGASKCLVWHRPQIYTCPLPAGWSSFIQPQGVPAAADFLNHAQKGSAELNRRSLWCTVVLIHLAEVPGGLVESTGDRVLQPSTGSW